MSVMFCVFVYIVTTIGSGLGGTHEYIHMSLMGGHYLENNHLSWMTFRSNIEIRIFNLWDYMVAYLSGEIDNTIHFVCAKSIGV